jgi:DNA methylase
MTAVLVASAPAATVYAATWAELADVVEGQGGCDSLIVDPPFSTRTHKGYQEGRLIAKRAASFGERKGRAERRGLDYAAWSDADMIRFLRRWGPLTRGWVCVLTDNVLAPIIEGELDNQGRLVFPPVPCIDPGGRVRFAGDGPSSNTVWLIVARPRGAPYHKWGTRRGYYLPPPGYSERGLKLASRLPGAKTHWLMQSIVDDYTRPGDLVCDPCCGGGTTLRAAQTMGRVGVGGDLDAKTAAKAARLVGKPAQQLIRGIAHKKSEKPQQERLFV